MAERGKILESIASGDVGKIRMYLRLVFDRSHDRRHSLHYSHMGASEVGLMPLV